MEFRLTIWCCHWRSTIVNPFQDFAHGGFLTVHENADAIDLAGEPRHAEG